MTVSIVIPVETILQTKTKNTFKRSAKCSREHVRSSMEVLYNMFLISEYLACCLANYYTKSARNIFCFKTIKNIVLFVEGNQVTLVQFSMMCQLHGLYSTTVYTAPSLCRKGVKSRHVLFDSNTSLRIFEYETYWLVELSSTTDEPNFNILYI